MPLNLTLQYPLWYLLLCAALAGGGTYLLYFLKDDFTELNKWLKRCLALCRFLTLFIISVLLLSPLLATLHREVLKPKIVLLRDNSGSITTGGNQKFAKDEFIQKWKNLQEKLSEKYEVIPLAFSDLTSADGQPDYKGKLTDLSQSLQYVQDVFSNQNVGSIIMATDGIYNQGSSPIYLAKQLNIPLYTVGLGDTTLKKDLLIAGVNQNKYAYLGNNFPLEISIEAKKMDGAKSILKVMDESGNILYSEAIQAKGNRFQKNSSVLLKATKPGLIGYKISIEPVAGELTTANNTAEVFIEVLDGRQKLLLLYAVPHPDIAALKNTLEANENYEVEVSSVLDFKKNTNGYNLVIVHNMPTSNGTGQNLLQELSKNDVPLLFVLGSGTSYASFNALNTGINISAKSSTVNESQAASNRNFTLFTLSPETQEQIQKFPPLLAPFADYKTSPATQSLLYQKIGAVATEQPLLAFGQMENKKVGVVVGENIWKWRLADYYQNDSHKHFDELISKLVQYLAAKQDKSQFRIITKNKYLENESVVFEGELYNDSYELINTTDIDLVLKNASGKTFNYSLGKTSNAYRLDAGMYPAGVYTYQATAKIGDKMLKTTGRFVVSEIKLEYVNTTADHQLLRTLSASTKGKYFPPSQIDSIAVTLMKNEQLKPVIYNYSTFDEAIHLKWIFLLLIVLLATEWFIRKWAGGY